VALKILLGLGLLSFSALRQTGMDAREAEDAVNDFGRAAVGETKEETVRPRILKAISAEPGAECQEYHKQTSDFLSKAEDDLPEYSPPAVAVSSAAAHSSESDKQADLNNDKKAKSVGKKGKKWKLEEVERWTMVKRIW
jgi:hypothetical protein